ncbi:Alpha/beta hydrolase family protein [Poriferisphaera corsica]|uniref:Alpha/beta hydrolase family protein n=1 Tax=Poriferisphaera corsica TaxID=2528020 RepID=A0A517YVK5_9BACT|nr:alpha/beta fold hydrolase [Poriferisphaera corsica]QDU34212.1 Alpha/beta hydrolase family protein [Poriferisphaera corsica]
MPEVLEWTLEGADGEVIIGNTHLPMTDEPLGVLILCHGFKGYKDYGFMPRLAMEGAETGFVVHRFNFSHSGMTNKIETFERADLFEKDTWGKQIDDLKTVIGAVECGDLEGMGLPLVVFGHSRGGMTATLTVSEILNEDVDELGRSICGLITGAAPSYACFLSVGELEEIRTNGKVLSPSGRTGEDLYVGLGWLEEIEAEAKRFDPIRAMRKMRCPVCILHGTEDNTVPMKCAHELADGAGERAMRVIIPKADHVFCSPNPLGENDAIPAITHTFISDVVKFAENCVRG